MTWDEAVLSLLLASEEKVGSVVRNNARQARAQEDALAAASLSGVD
jgi:hypothetical protein